MRQKVEDGFQGERKELANSPIVSIKRERETISELSGQAKRSNFFADKVTFDFSFGFVKQRRQKKNFTSITRINIAQFLDSLLIIQILEDDSCARETYRSRFMRSLIEYLQHR